MTIIISQSQRRKIYFVSDTLQTTLICHTISWDTEIAVRFMKSFLFWCSSVESYHSSSFYHCDICACYCTHPIIHTLTHTTYRHIPPTLSIRPIISPVAGSNKAVTQQRLLAKSHHHFTLKQWDTAITTPQWEGEAVFLWAASRGLTGSSLSGREEENSCTHQFVNSSTEVGRLHLSLSSSYWYSNLTPDFLRRSFLKLQKQTVDGWLEWGIAICCNQNYSYEASVSSLHCGLSSHTLTLNWSKWNRSDINAPSL